MSNKQKNGEILIYQTEDGETKIEVRFENETVWLTQMQMTVNKWGQIQTSNKPLDSLLSLVWT